MNAFNLLRKEHRTIKTLLLRLLKTRRKAGDRRRDLFAKILQKLRNHSQVEVGVFYPVLRRVPTENASARVDQALRGHERIEAVLTRMSNNAALDARFDSLVQQLTEAVERHVQDEEADLFVIAKNRLPPVQLVALCARMKELWAALDRPPVN